MDVDMLPLILLQPAALVKVTLLHGYFSRFLNCANGTKSRKESHIYILCSPRAITSFCVLRQTVLVAFSVVSSLECIYMCVYVYIHVVLKRYHCSKVRRF